MKTPHRSLIFVLMIILLSLVISAPKNYVLNFKIFGRNISLPLSSPSIKFDWPFTFERDLTLKQGLDLQGGLEVTLGVDMNNIKLEDRQDALDSVREVISKRVDLYGVTEPVITTKRVGDDYRLAVALPGLDNPSAALDLIGQTAKLEFAELESSTSSAELETLIPTTLTGKDLVKASIQFSQETGQPEVGLIFSDEGGQKFADITGRNIGKPLAITLDGIPVSAPIVQTKIEGGQASINGQFTIEEAKSLAIKLNAGALPVPISILEQKNIAPTLGAQSVEASLRAGLVGLSIVVIFMIIMYGWLGVIASFGLLVYGLITISLYKLIPITITLPGLAGFILSIGMAVDSNILVFERMKEEIRKGHDKNTALELGFGQAWDAIKDANIATLITTFILFNPLEWEFLNSSGLVRGFALTLFLGIVVSLFTGIVVTRTLLRIVYAKYN